MNKKMDAKTKYTEAAIAQLNKFKDEQARLLEKEIIESKSYPGIDFIEITASDIQDFSRNISYAKGENKKTDVRYVLVYTYFVLGVLLIIFGAYYDSIVNIWYNKPRQATYMIAGVLISLVSAISLYLMKRMEARKSFEQRKMNEEFRKYQELNEMLRSKIEIKRIDFD